MTTIQSASLELARAAWLRVPGPDLSQGSARPASPLGWAGGYQTVNAQHHRCLNYSMTEALGLAGLSQRTVVIAE